ncbi:Serrate RNA effector molecule [Phytophthora citrophthora]|uniref:Serrate RNA effector molecule n=1 Tax=Phytophthora citrophthora TaxID=4793 RepID=A0AAD9GNL1_9STRA|nr:Serrate RNA effector molecule [Phytophthora citrophthora]
MREDFAPYPDQRFGRRDSRDNYDMRFRGPRGRSRSRSPRRARGPEWDANPRFDDGPRRDARASSLPEPLVSYKVWMMRQTDEASPEVYQQRYEEYKKKHVQRVLRAFFELHKREEWLQERYSPALRHRVEKIKTTQQINEAKQFGERVRAGTAKICLDEQPPVENGENPLGEDFANDLENSARVLYIRRVPCACPVGTLSETIKKAGGPFVHLYLSDPVKKSAFDFDRSAYIIYDSAAAASDAMPKIHNTFVEDGNQFPPFRLQVSPHRARAPLKTPSYLSVPERLTADYNQALALAKALDARLFHGGEDKLARFGIDALLVSEEVAQNYSTDKQKLDVVVAYLRRVHHYIYYAGVQCLDMGDIMHAHPALFCRPPPSARDIEEEKARQEAAAAKPEEDAPTEENKDDAANTEAGEKEPAAAVTSGETAKAIGGWAAALDEKVQAYLKELEPEVVAAKRAKDRAIVDEIEAREEAALESTYSNYGEKASDDGKHRCRLCTKLFKAMDFVKKHIRNKHPELVVDKIAEVGESYMWEQYREDEQHPMPPLETSNSMPGGAVLGGRAGGTNGGRNGGGYRGRPERDFNGGGRGFYRDDGYRGRGPPMRDDRMRRGSFDRPPRSPPRYNGGGGGYGRSPSRGPPSGPPRIPDSELPVDPRQVSTSYRDLDNLQDTKVELSFDALDSLPPPKKKTKV